MTLSAVLLDVGGVFVLPDDRVLLAAISAAGVSTTADDLARSHYHGIAAMDRAALAKGVTADWPRYTRAMVAALGVPEDLRDVVAAAITAAFAEIAWSRVVPGSIEALRKLAATGVALGIVSNSNGTVEAQLIDAQVCQVGEGHGVPVAVVVDSFVAGVEKPHPDIFHLALNSLGVAPDEALHVGDTWWADVAGARAAGVRPIHLDPYGLCPAPDDHEHVEDLNGVVDLVLASVAGR